MPDKVLHVKRLFLEILSSQLGLDGYCSIKSGVFRKKGEDQFYYQINCIFVGRASISCDLYFGFFIDDVESAAKELAQVKSQNAAGSKDFPTIFSRLAYVSEWAGLKFDYTLEIDNVQDINFGSLRKSINTIEQMVKSRNQIVDFVLTNSGLPLGHHAFRVPILLQIENKTAELNQYLSFVSGTGAVPNYDAYIDSLKMKDV